jgi:hypothetical protein
MKPIEFEGQAVLLDPPQGVQGVGKLPIKREFTMHGHAICVSYWRPSKAELAILNAGGHVALYIMGRTMPPALVMAEAGIKELP